ncbi:MAG: hypothetical protein HYS05_01205 [Acidobacteria bacterium]|nr:hypothetical protein [Acidobacteriota bacterium]
MSSTETKGMGPCCSLPSNTIRQPTPVSGSFAYTPSAGTVLNAGTQTLSTTFTPPDKVIEATDTDTGFTWLIGENLEITFGSPATASLTNAGPIVGQILTDKGKVMIEF